MLRKVTLLFTSIWLLGCAPEPIDLGDGYELFRANASDISISYRGKIVVPSYVSECEVVDSFILCLRSEPSLLKPYEIKASVGYGYFILDKNSGNTWGELSQQEQETLLSSLRYE